MITKQKSAGYFDSLRNEPMYEGDVYYRKGYIEPFYKIIKSEDKGFVVNHVNTREYFPLSSMGSTLVNSQYIGNILDNPNIIEEFKNNPSDIIAGPKLTNEVIADAENKFVTPSADKLDTVGQENEKTENATVSTDIELDNVGQNPTDEQNNEECEQNRGENEQVSADNTTNATDEQNPDAIQEDGNGTNDAEDAADAEEKTKNDEAAGTNIVIEKAQAPVPEVIANTKEEKNAIERRNFCKKQIEKNNEDIAKLQEKADFHNELAKTLTYPPFTKLEKIILENLHKDVDSKGIKDIKDGTKVLENIVAIQEVLKEHSLQAANAENHISDLEDENSKFEDEIAELEEKIGHFAAQTKLNLDIKEEQVSEGAPSEETNAEPETIVAGDGGVFEEEKEAAEETTDEAACEIVTEAEVAEV